MLGARWGSVFFTTFVVSALSCGGQSANNAGSGAANAGANSKQGGAPTVGAGGTATLGSGGLGLGGAPTPVGAGGTPIIVGASSAGAASAGSDNPDSPAVPPCGRAPSVLTLLDWYAPAAPALISPTGHVVVLSNTAIVSETGVLRWSAETAGLERIADTNNPHATAMSDDGAAIVGLDDHGAFLWRDGQTVRLPFDEAPAKCPPLLSADGLRAVGCVLGQAAIWSESDGFTLLGKASSGAPYTLPVAGNHDLSVVVGVAYDMDSFDNVTTRQAFLWRAEAGLETLALPDSAALDVSEDGSVVVGVTGSSAFRRRVGAAAELTPNAGGVRVSDDGVTTSGNSGQGVFLWDGSGSLRRPPPSPDVPFESTLKLAASADNRRLVLETLGAFFGGELLLWDVGADSTTPLEPHVGALIKPETLSADGRVLIGSGTCNNRNVALRALVP